MADYLSINESSEGFFKDKGSKFCSFLHPVKNEAEVKKWIDFYKESQPSARHYCYAYRMGPSGEAYRAYDDGEPGGTAGKPMLNQLLSHNITNVLVVIVRYFGGTKLGVSGLIAAYKGATIDAIVQAEIVEKFKTNFYKVSFTYKDLPDVMKWTKQNPIEIIEQEFNLNCILKIEIKEGLASEVIKRLPFGISSEQII